MKKGIISIISALIGAAIGGGAAEVASVKERDKVRAMSDKYLALFLMMNQWVKIKQENKSLTDYLEKNGYKGIAIYGMNYVGETLLSELSGSNINVKYAIDRNADNIYSDVVSVITPDDDFEKVDAVIVTPITYFDEIEKALSEKISCPILSIEDILYEI